MKEKKENKMGNYILCPFLASKNNNFFFQRIPYKATFSEVKATFQRSGR
jgi:hypothetical protein